MEEDEEEEEVETLCATSDVEIFDAFNASMYFKPCVSKALYNQWIATTVFKINNTVGLRREAMMFEFMDIQTMNILSCWIL